METITRDKLVTFLEKNILLDNFQQSFRNKRSSLTNLLDSHNDVFNIYDETKSVDTINLDCQKAFDKVPHKRLPKKKIELHAIAGKILK